MLQCFSKPLVFSTLLIPRIFSFNIYFVVALLEACDVTNNGRHFGFYQELEIRLKPQQTVFFFALDM